MPKPVPTPVAAAIGVVPTAFDGVRRLPSKAVQLPVLAVSHTLTLLDIARREYDVLADRGERLIGKLRGRPFPELEDRFDEMLQRTPLEKAYHRVEDAVEDAVASVTDLFDHASASTRAPAAPQTPARPVTRIDTAAKPAAAKPAAKPAAAKAKADKVSAADALPLAGYDTMTLGGLRGRLRTLSLDQLVAIRGYEKSHADRLPVVTMLDNRIAKLTKLVAEATSALAATTKTSGRTAPKKTAASRTTARTKASAN